MQRCNAEIDWNCKLIWGRLNTLCFRFSFAFAFAFFRFVSYLQRLLLLLLCRCCRRNSARYWALQVRTKHADNNNNSNSNMRERQLRWLRRRRRQLIGNWAHETCCVGNNNSSNTTTTSTRATFAQCICQSVVAVVVFWILYLINCSGNLQIQLADTDTKAQLHRYRYIYSYARAARCFRFICKFLFDFSLSSFTLSKQNASAHIAHTQR